MSPFVLSLMSSSDIGINPAAFNAGAEPGLLVDPAQLMQHGILIVTAIVFHEIASAAFPVIKCMSRALLSWWKRWRNRQ